MKTQEQIIQRIEEVKEEDFFGFQKEVLVCELTCQNALPYLKEGTELDALEWDNKLGHIPDKIRDYLSYAWEKANDRRGLSANRSLIKFQAWLWLDDKEEMAEHLFDDYAYYGKPALVKVSEAYEFPWRQYDDGHWANDEGKSYIR